MGWNHGAQNITKFLNRDNLTINVVRHYGQIAKTNLKSGCKEFCKAGGMCFQGRATQNNHMMAQCLKKSLTVAALACLKPYQSQYLFNRVEYGPLMYKIIMRLATMDSIATNEALQANINSLPQYATSANGDVNLINSYFDVNMSQLLARVQTVDNPIESSLMLTLPLPITRSGSTLQRSKTITTTATWGISLRTRVSWHRRRQNSLTSQPARFGEPSRPTRNASSQ
jgi:hypothetical protein